VTLDDIKDWIAVGGTIGTMVLGFAFLWLKDRFVTKETHAAHVAEVGTMKRDAGAVRERVGAIESELRHLPSREGVTRMEIALGVVESDIKALDDKVDRVVVIADRLQEYLLTRSARE
jgi:hypothetical protein